MKKIFTITILICMMLIASIAWSAVIYVPGDYPNIQAGIDAAMDGDTVLVADGIYTGEGNRDIDLKGKAITVKSENGADVCVVDCEGTFLEPHRGFDFHSGEEETSVVDGFTIQNGWANDDGGGVYCGSSSPTLINNIITGNTANNHGGGVYCSSSSPTLMNNEITANTANGCGGGVYCGSSSPTLTNNEIIANTANNRGGGVYCYSSSPTLTNNEITANIANNHGGGVSCEYSSSPTLTNNIITGNTANSYGGGVHCEYSSSPTLTNNIITANTANYDGGGVSCHSSSSPTLTNNIITANTANAGGGVYCYDASSPTLMNNTIADNTANYGGGIYCYKYSGPILINCILWGDAPQEIYFESSYPNGIVVSYSDVQGGKDGIVSEHPDDIIDWGEGNIDADPSFVDAGNDDYHLNPDSPCIDAGTPDGVSDDDLEGNPRDEFPDMGAYEYQGISIRIISPPDGAEFPAGDVVDVVAEVKDEFDKPMVWVWVDFASTGGPVEPTTVVTDANGQAVTQLTVAEGENIVTATLTDYPGISDTVTVIGLALIGSINGHVIDFRGFPLGALVIAIKEPIKEKTLTESPTGYYEIPNLEPGNYWVICIKKGYKNGIKQVEVEAGQVTTCNFLLGRKVE
ncbi:right-handed parallel beta-helix repeat-containing protein [bacterium]|nr:right-handed parallel beta-helix repeat-containing protein [bacterium]